MRTNNKVGEEIIFKDSNSVLNAGRVDCVKKLRDEKPKNIVKGKIKR